MQMPAPAGGTLGWQIEQYGPNGPLPHTGAGAVFLCAGRSWGAVDFRRNNGKKYTGAHRNTCIVCCRQTGARQCCEKNHSNALQHKSCETARKNRDFAVDSALLPTDPAKLCTECQRKFGCNIILKFFKMRDFLDKFYLRESFMRKIHK